MSTKRVFIIYIVVGINKKHLKKNICTGNYINKMYISLKKKKNRIKWSLI